MGNDTLTISESEREVMKVLWKCQSATVREIRERLAAAGRQWAHTTINTLLTRLEQKHCVTCDRSGFSHIFAAAVSRDELMQQRLASLADDFCDGTRVPLMLALVEGQKFSDEEIEQFRNLIDQLESSRRRGKRSSGKGRKS
ncbi:MAG: BlaI/MecI/CopY family transcriptional regulator [Fuerstiella sp.]